MNVGKKILTLGKGGDIQILEFSKDSIGCMQGLHTVKDGDLMVEQLVNNHNLSILAFDRFSRGDLLRSVPFVSV